MIKSVGIDLAGTGEHKVRCLDERAQLCDGFGFQTTLDGLTKLEERVFVDTHGQSPWHFINQASLDLNAGAATAYNLSPLFIQIRPNARIQENHIHPRAKPVELCPSGY